ncbi:unnamed protein product, partial [Prorocentrum cordatum]
MQPTSPAKSLGCLRLTTPPATDPRAVVRPFRTLLLAYEPLVEEVETLSRAMQIVRQKLLLMATPQEGPGPVHRALEAHPGALETIVARLIDRMEGFRQQTASLRGRFVAQHGLALLQARAALQLWLNRQEVGAAPPAGNLAAASARGALSSLADVEVNLDSWGRLAACPYLGREGDQWPWQEALGPRVDVQGALAHMGALVE